MKEEEEEEIKKKKLIDRPLGVKNRLDFIQQNIYKNIKNGEPRFSKLYSTIENTFPMSTNERGFVDAILVTALDTTLELFFLGKNSSLFVELQGVLERFCYNALSDILPVDMQNSKIIINNMMDKKTLSDFAEYMKILNIWTEDDKKFAGRLTAIRNGIAHKNVKMVSKYLSDGKQQHYFSIDALTEKADVTVYIIDVLRLMVKISHVITSPILKNPRLKVRYERYTSAVGALASMFCFPEIIKMPKDLKDLYLIDFFMPLNLISTDKLGNKFREYQSKVIEFHDKLGIDANYSKQLHSELYDLFYEIFELMRNELKIDIDKELLIKKPVITMEEIRKIKETQKHYE